MANKIRKQRVGKVNWLIFVDTNIFLDFYRLGGDSAKRTLAQLERHSSSLILTDQVWMEFLKNRQKVILQTMKEIHKPSNQGMPPLLNEVQSAKQLAKHQKLAAAQHNKLIQKIESILRNPSKEDPVYKSLQKLFARTSPLSLRRPDPRRYSVRRAATKRFSLGYPPRKDDTLRLGDSINWEWIIECAIESRDKANILVVSRDGDFGTTYTNEIFLNDWLRTEFKERVSRQRKIELTNRLSIALKRLDATVRKSDVEEEDRILKTNLNRTALMLQEHSPLRSQLLNRLLAKTWAEDSEENNDAAG